MLRLPSQNFPYAGFPSIAVVSTSVAKISEAGISMMSLERTVKSARFPGVNDPNVDSVNDAYAASRVIPGKERIYGSTKLPPDDIEVNPRTLQCFFACETLLGKPKGRSHLKKEVPATLILTNECTNLPPVWAMRRCTIRGETSDSGIEASHRIDGFDWTV